MKFAFVITSLAGGGAEKALIKLAEGLHGRGHEVHFVLLEDRVDYPLPQGCRLQVIPSRGGRVSSGLLGKRITAWRLKRLFARLSRDGAFDLIVSTLPYADEVAGLAGLPAHWCRIANTLSAEVEALARRDSTKGARRLARYRRMYGQAKLIAVSDGVATDLRDRLGLAGARIERLYNPFDLAAIRTGADAPAALPDAPYIIHIGRFARQKRHDLLLAAYRAADLPQRLVLLTHPDARLDALIAEYGLAGRVLVAGFQANPYPWIAGAELLVLCSDHEGLPNVLIEALACGSRVVSTDCPSGPAEILRGEFARSLVPCGDIAALAAALRAALAAPRPARAVVDAALAPFAADIAVAAYERLARGAMPA